MAFFWALVTMTFNLYPNFQDSSAWEKRCRCFACIAFCGAKRTTLAESESDWVSRLADLMSKVPEITQHPSFQSHLLDFISIVVVMFATVGQIL